MAEDERRRENGKNKSAGVCWDRSVCVVGVGCWNVFDSKSLPVRKSESIRGSEGRGERVGRTREGERGLSKSETSFDYFSQQMCKVRCKSKQNSSLYIQKHDDVAVYSAG